jgi:AcrR family transcriptional regulator
MSTVIDMGNVRRRYSADERRRMILEGAIDYFADFGFDVRTRELAEHLGISQSLIFRYFPNMAALIDSVYDVVFLNRWNNEWESALVDRTHPLRTRLLAFYRDYFRSIGRYEVIRISLYSALRGETLNQRYMQLVRERLIHPIVVELRVELGLDASADSAVTPLEEELVFGLHGSVIYTIIRKHVFGLDVADDVDFMIELLVDNFLAGIGDTFRRARDGALTSRER